MWKNLSAELSEIFGSLSAPTTEGLTVEEQMDGKQWYKATVIAGCALKQGWTSGRNAYGEGRNKSNHARISREYRLRNREADLLRKKLYRLRKKAEKEAQLVEKATHSP
jgi:hypothetical protein